jgi:hypothetical protein
MFLLDQLPVSALEKSGLKIRPEELLRLSRSVVQVSSGGTGSFVSSRGLVVTNHHVAYRCIAALGSRKEHLGLLERGHTAATQADELPCPGYDLLVVDQVRDVTADVLAAVKPAMSWTARFEAIRLRKEDLVQSCERDGAHICEVAALDGGTGHLLTVYRRIRDVRLVYAPPKALGKFGGDVDNWMFPRHTADFAFLRAYVGPRGEPAPAAKENVPLSTPIHLDLSLDGVREASLVTVIGFPARTSRHATSHAVRFYRDDQLPAAIALLDGLIGVLRSKMAADEDVQRKYAALESGLQNGRKYYEMSRQGFVRWKTLENKLEMERVIRQRSASDTRTLHAMDDLLRRIGQIFARYRTYHQKLAALSRLSGFACPTVRVAFDLAKWAKEKAKADRMRKDERYKDKNVYRIKEASARLEKEINLAAEKALLLFVLRHGEKLAPAERPKATAALLRWSRAELGRLRASARGQGEAFAVAYRESFGVAPAPDALETAVDMMYGGTQLVGKTEDPKEIDRAVKLRARLFELPAAALTKLGDPLVSFGQHIEAELTALKEGPYREVEQHLGALLHPRWVKEILRPSYPDANYTVRLSLGSVRDYRSAETGKTHRHLSTLSGLLAKDQGVFPFAVPARLKAAFPHRMRSPYVDPRVKDIPVNFTTTLDTTGGNSGSPVLDDHGRLVGLLFDGTPESILSDWQFLEGAQRSICLDLRFALYLVTLDQNQRLLSELGAGRTKAQPSAAQTR